MLKVLADISYLRGRHFSFGMDNDEPKKRKLPESLNKVHAKPPKQTRAEISANIAQRQAAAEAVRNQQATQRQAYQERRAAAAVEAAAAAVETATAEAQERRERNAAILQEREEYDRENTCGICLATMYGRPTTTPCNHRFHTECICEWFAKSNRDNKIKACPLCRAPFTDEQVNAMCPEIAIPKPTFKLPADFTPGMSFQDMATRINPNTGQPFTYYELRQ